MSAPVIPAKIPSASANPGGVNQYYGKDMSDIIDVLKRYLSEAQSATITSATTLDDTHGYVRINAASSSFNVTIPDAGTHQKKMYILKRIDTASANTVNFQRTGSVDTFDSLTGPIELKPGQTEILISDGADKWDRIQVGAANPATNNLDMSTFYIEGNLANAPATPATNKVRLYPKTYGSAAAFSTKNEFGREDIIGPDTWRSRRPIEAYPGDNSSEIHVRGFGITPTVTGTATRVAATSTVASYQNWPTAASTDAEAGWKTTTDLLFRAYNFDITFRFAVLETAARRAYIGFFESDPMAVEGSGANAIHHIALRVSSSAGTTGFVVSRSDGTTQAESAQLAAADTNWHTFRVMADNAGARFGYSFDAAAMTFVTTNIPSSTQALRPLCQVRTLEAVAKNLGFAWMQGDTEI